MIRILRYMGFVMILALSAAAPAPANELTADPAMTLSQRGATLTLPGEPCRPPGDERYLRLEEKLAHYQALADTGGWPTIRTRQTLDSGSRHPEVIKLRLRLALTNDYLGALVISDVFDQELEQGVRRFQRRHGLKEDGRVGPKTRAALNVPAKARVAQIIVNLERLQQNQISCANQYLLVNIPAFQLDAVAAGQSMLSMRVITGRPGNCTPTFTETLDYLVVNPYWNVPTKLATRDFLPKLRRDPEQIARRGIRLYSGWSETAEQLDPASIDWHAIKPYNFPFKLRQDPGPYNALGRLKFVLPNRHAIYLHDTPSRHLFQRDSRAFSSGCIRVEQPLELAAYLLAGQDGWTRSRLQKQMDSGQRKVIHIRDKQDVHVVYWTAWVDPEGTLHFRDDIYDRDRQVLRAISSRQRQTVASSNNY